ncbi:hypothetical protein F4560_005373 [Saccharothrix ecbatanensis]|uniref:Alanine and proline-rich secreted protein Apa n=1 Tax=Saccharothrix ecbatanensis TaxID=1105145 RepID=A0A7W9HNR0_9PSEU|nr:hypothetical protein [Saccharothrix ecbatanensis]MBB5805605.1 hypothetical protein [Saccharothrix ecbatanensis]
MANPRKPGRRQVAALPLALSITAVYLVVGGAAGTLALQAKSSAPVPIPSTSSSPLPRITTTTPPAPPAAVPTSSTPPALPAGFRLVEAPGGLTTAVPEGWTINTGTVATTLVATDPTNPRREIRLGGAPVTDPSTTLLARITAAAVEREQEPGHTRLALAETRIREFPAVRWDFEEIVDGVAERVAVAYWETGGIEYVVYAARPAEEWPKTQSDLKVLTDNARP